METWSEVYTGPHLEVRVATRRSAAFVQLIVTGGGLSFHSSVLLEFLLQGQDRLGLPLGPPTRVHLERISLLKSPQGQDVHGSAWLSRRLDSALLRRCHLRVWPDPGLPADSSPNHDCRLTNGVD